MPRHTQPLISWVSSTAAGVVSWSSQRVDDPFPIRCASSIVRSASPPPHQLLQHRTESRSTGDERKEVYNLLATVARPVQQRALNPPNIGRHPVLRLTRQANDQKLLLRAITAEPLQTNISTRQQSSASLILGTRLLAFKMSGQSETLKSDAANTAVQANLLGQTDIWVSRILPIVGPGHYLFVAGVNH